MAKLADGVPNLLKFSEVCTILRVSDKTLRAMLLRGDLPAVKVGRQWRIRAIQLDKYFEKMSDRPGK